MVVFVGGGITGGMIIGGRVVVGGVMETVTGLISVETMVEMEVVMTGGPTMVVVTDSPALVMY